MSYVAKTYTDGETVDAAELLNQYEKNFQRLFNELNGDTVWENLTPKQTFTALTQEITCEKSVKYFEVLYAVGTNDESVISTGKIAVTNTAYLQILNTHVYWRTAKITQTDSTVELNISACTRRTIASSPASSTQNGFIIPIEVKFYYE